MFVRNQRGEDNKTNDQRVHEYYRNNIFLPFIARTREHYLEDRELKEGNAIDDDDLWVSWQVRTFFFSPLETKNYMHLGGMQKGPFPM